MIVGSSTGRLHDRLIDSFNSVHAREGDLLRYCTIPQFTSIFIRINHTDFPCREVKNTYAALCYPHHNQETDDHETPLTMPTYLIHGFRWERSLIRIHTIINNLEEAAPEWIMAPATSNTFLNSFYTLYDFLPPSDPPVPFDAPPTPLDAPLNSIHIPPPPPIPEASVGRRMARSLSKKHTKSMASLRSISRKRRPTTSGGPPVSMDNYDDPEHSMSTAGSEKRKSDRPSTAGHSSNLSSTSHPHASSNGDFKPRHSGAHNKPHSTTSKPRSFNDWSVVKLLEQYDLDEEVASQPYAYVGDYIREIRL